MGICGRAQKVDLLNKKRAAGFPAALPYAN